MITLCLTSTVGALRLDRPAVSVGALTLIRHASRLYAEVEEAWIGLLTRELAYAGIAITRCGPLPVPSNAAPPELILAIARRLDPFPNGAYAFDVCRVRRVDLGAATRCALRRWLPWLRPASPRARELCRRLLRGEDGVIGWQRRVWLPASALRDGRVREIVRPVVFGTADADDTRRRSLASAGELERWAS